MSSGPRLIFDKSAVQMLSPAEVFELSIFFDLVGTPVLRREILTDLEGRSDGTRMPRQVLQALAAKMVSAPMQPINHRRAVFNNLFAHEISMTGALCFDASAPNVRINPDGGIFIDLVPDQRIWQQWAAGDFSPIDEHLARRWRSQVDQIDTESVRAHWRDFTQQHFMECKNVSDIVSVIDEMMDRFDYRDQGEFLRITLDFLKAPATIRRPTLAMWRSGLMPRLKDIAPYAAFVTRIMLAYSVALARGFVAPRKSDFLDLQYLFYTPFCWAFASRDKLQRELWPATRGVRAVFIWGDDLKADLKRRAELRKENPKGVAGTIPIELPGSVINDVWRKCAQTPPITQHPRRSPSSVSPAVSVKETSRMSIGAAVAKYPRVMDQGEKSRA